MHKGYAYQIFNSCFFQITRVQPNLLEQKQHELDIKSWSSKTKQKSMRKTKELIKVLVPIMLP